MLWRHLAGQRICDPPNAKLLIRPWVRWSKLRQPIGPTADDPLIRKSGSSDQWVIRPMGHRTNGSSDQWVIGQMVVGPMGHWTNGSSDQWVIGQMVVGPMAMGFQTKWPLNQCFPTNGSSGSMGRRTIEPSPLPDEKSWTLPPGLLIN